MSQVVESTDHPEPVIEPSNGGATTVDLATRALHLRIRQQEILAELGVQALQGKPFLDLLDQTARLTAEGMEAEFCKALEYMPAENRFLVRAGVGWQEGIVGVATVGADARIFAGLSFGSLPLRSVIAALAKKSADRSRRQERSRPKSF